jgi:hypothetical protein
MATGLAVFLSLVGCAANAAHEARAKPPRDAHLSVHTVLPSPPIDCEGIDGLETAQSLVDSGDAVALISVTISDQPGSVENVTRAVPVTDFRLLAGRLPSGPLKVIEESGANDTVNILEPASYVLLLGDGEQSSTYFLSDGRRGSFLVEGDDAYEQCPNYADTTRPFIVKEGVTKIGALTELFAEALNGR